MGSCSPCRRSFIRGSGLTTMILCCAMVASLPRITLAQTASSWVFFGRHGKLEYKTDPAGNHILDYSSAGYQGGGVSPPRVPARVTVFPSGGDDTQAIQSAIDTISALAPDRRGFRGAVRLSAGTFSVSTTLKITTGGVVLRGDGSAVGGTVLTMTGSPFTLLAVAGSGTYARGTAVPITDTYVPSGATSFSVSDASGLHVGETILVSRPVTAAWVAFMGMDTLV